MVTWSVTSTFICLIIKVALKSSHGENCCIREAKGGWRIVVQINSNVWWSCFISFLRLFRMWLWGFQMISDTIFIRNLLKQMVGSFCVFQLQSDLTNNSCVCFSCLSNILSLKTTLVLLTSSHKTLKYVQCCGTTITSILQIQDAASPRTGRKICVSIHSEACQVLFWLLWSAVKVKAGAARRGVWPQHPLNGLWWSADRFYYRERETGEVCVCVCVCVFGIVKLWIEQDGTLLWLIEWCCLIQQLTV